MKREEIDLVKKFAAEAGLTVRGDSIIANGQRLMLGENVTISDIVYNLETESILMDIESPADIELQGRIEHLAKRINNLSDYGLEEVKLNNLNISGITFNEGHYFGHIEFRGHEALFDANVETGGIQYMPRTQDAYDVIKENMDSISKNVREEIENLERPTKVDIEDIEL